MMPSAPSFRSALRAFSLMELLVTIAVLSLLMALVFPLLGHIRERSREARCLQNLRQAGALLITAVTEKGGVFPAWYSGSTGGEFWNTWLVREKYLTLDGLEKLACPSIPYADASGNYSGRHYGIYMPDTDRNLVNFQNEAGALTGRAYRIDFRRITEPAGTIFLADSVTSAGNPSVRIFRSNSASFPSGAFHSRHGGRANLFFYDGHAESASYTRLHSLGVSRVYDARLQPVDLLNR